MTMTTGAAADKADKLLLEIIRCQPQFWPQNVFANDSNPELLGKRIATFRQTLMEELKKQD